MKLNSFIISDKIIDKMKEQIKSSKIDKHEHGFSLCSRKKSNNLVIGNDCIGSDCRILRPFSECKNADEYQGLFHTHPSGSIKPSIADLFNIYEDGLGCIGGNQIKCFVRKDSALDKSNLLKILNAGVVLDDVSNKLPKEEFEKLRDAIVGHITEKNFKVVDIHI